ncbi:lysophospholipase [Cellulomonas bogoriensis 69B4 = DSM 16987]|uniref:Lysophospholipase n=1 Tax=Cellulomonas bogoriensis 69B4 = DSM 16987 TaxID=1386082 RepID=A0A0A0BZX0_9CELL|nr:lysophospholipase [Cellulomonas bogoriensis 69B4 = DSM 16987]
MLGPDWEHTTLALGRDVDGPLVATLVRQTGAPTRGPAALHVHGYNDYFFHTHVADALARAGWTLYGLDLRRSGRSRRPGQLPHWTTDLSEYHTELDMAADVLARQGHDRLAVIGHSTGGLVGACWAHERRSTTAVDAVVLNSPWLDLNGPWHRRLTTAAALAVIGRVRPRRVVERRPSSYSARLHVDAGGRWAFDQAFKPPTGVPVRAGWLLAVRRAQARVARGLDIRVPVLVCTSGSSGPGNADNPRLDRQETVLDVRHMWRLAPRLGRHVTVSRIDGGVHDLSLSGDAPREEYLRTVTGFLDRVARATRPG